MGNTQQTNQDAKNALDPTLNGFVTKLDPTKNGFVTKLDPTKNGFSDKLLNDPNIQKIANNGTVKQVFQNLDPKNVKSLIDKIKNDLKPQNVNHTVNNSINPKETTKEIINDPTLNKILNPVKPYIQPTINKVVNPIVDNLSTTISPNDLVNSGITIANQVIKALEPTKTVKTDNTIIYLIIGGILAGIYIFVPNKKKIIK
jgi:hypothetical protein